MWSRRCWLPFWEQRLHRPGFSLIRRILRSRRMPGNLRLTIVMRNLRISLSAVLLMAAVAGASAQKRMPQEQMPKNGPKATLVRVANLYAQPDEAGDRVAQITPGREMVVVERSGHWLRVFANIDAPESRTADQPVME